MHNYIYFKTYIHECFPIVNNLKLCRDYIYPIYNILSTQCMDRNRLAQLDSTSLIYKFLVIFNFTCFYFELIFFFFFSIPLITFFFSIQVEPGTNLFPAVIFEPTIKEMFQFELGRTKVIFFIRTFRILESFVFFTRINAIEKELYQISL